MLDTIREEKISKEEVLSWKNNTTSHVLERINRLSEIDFDRMQIEIAFMVDKGHKDGYEIHVITRRAEILIFNYNTHRMITVLFARPKQITRYRWKNPQMFNRILGVAIQNERTGKNNI